MLTVGAANGVPDQDSGQADDGQHQAQRCAHQEFAPHDAPPVFQAQFADGHRADDESGGLRTGVAAAADDQGQKERQDNCLGDLIFEIAHCRRGEHFTQEQHRQPSGALLDHAQDADLKIRSIERFTAACFLNIFTGFLLHHRDDVVHGDDAHHALLIV